MGEVNERNGDFSSTDLLILSARLPMHTVEKMRSRLKFNSAVLFVLTGLFVFAVYNLSRLRVPPFSLDPCDAVMHFAVFTVVVALIGSLRPLLPYQKRMSHAAQDTHVLRSQQAVAL